MNAIRTITEQNCVNRQLASRSASYEAQYNLEHGLLVSAKAKQIHSAAMHAEMWSRLSRLLGVDAVVEIRAPGE